MENIIFAYKIPTTNWLNPTWRRLEKRRREELKQKRTMVSLEQAHPEATCEELAKKLGVSRNHYSVLRTKYNLPKRRKEKTK